MLFREVKLSKLDFPFANSFSIEATVHAPVEKIWEFWSKPEHITQWCHASDDWHTTRSENDLNVGGKFLSRMEAKDGSMGFDFAGVYDEVIKNELISYTMGDGRKATINFNSEGSITKITETFEAEEMNTLELQKGGWQNILNSFKKYTESN